MKKDFIDLTDYERDTLVELVKRGIELKGGAAPRKGKGKTLAMIFRKPSTRTNVSFQMAMHRLGGRALYLGGEALQISRGESISDTARTLSRYVDALMIRTYSHREAVELAASSLIPVINGLTDLLHPCQALGDVMSVTEMKGERYGDIKLAYVGDGNNVCNSLINAAGIFGFSFSAAVPEGYEPDKTLLDKAREKNAAVRLLRDPDEAAEGADAVYTDVWTSMGDEDEESERRKVFGRYQVNASLLEKAKTGAMVMHCLPAHREEEITGEVLDGPQSYVFEQAENRMHIQEAILEYLL